MKECVQWKLVYDRKDTNLQRVSNLELLGHRPALNLLSYQGPHQLRELKLEMAELQLLIVLKVYISY